MADQQIPTPATDPATDPMTDGVMPTDADQVTDPTMVPFDDDAGGPTADKEDTGEPSDEKLDAQLGSLS